MNDWVREHFVPEFANNRDLKIALYNWAKLFRQHQKPMNLSITEGNPSTQLKNIIEFLFPDRDTQKRFYSNTKNFSYTTDLNSEDPKILFS
jgi:hypothetical protein